MTASASFEALGTSATVVVTKPAALSEARQLLDRGLQRFDESCSRFRPDSELSHANELAGAPASIGPLLSEAVAVALRAAEATDGLVSPTVGAALVAAGYDRTFELVRARDSWTFRPVALRGDAWRDVELDVEAGTLLVPPGVELDLGATAKALAADRAATAIAAELGCGVLVSLGGDVAVAGEPPATGWCIRIAEDHTAPLDDPGPAVALTAGGLATSSTTVRRWRTDDGEAHHVVDPRTARPAETPWRTVSVTAATCVDANVATLASLLLGERAPEWLAARGLHARLVARSGAVVHVGEWPVDLGAAA